MPRRNFDFGARDAPDLPLPLACKLIQKWVGKIITIYRIKFTNKFFNGSPGTNGSTLPAPVGTMNPQFGQPRILEIAAPHSDHNRESNRTRIEQ